MHQAWRNFDQRLEDKTTLMQTRMGESEELSVAQHISIEQQVKIDCARSVGNFSRAPQGIFNSQQPRHYLLRRR